MDQDKKRCIKRMDCIITTLNSHMKNGTLTSKGCFDLIDELHHLKSRILNYDNYIPFQHDNNDSEDDFNDFKPIHSRKQVRKKSPRFLRI